MRPTQRLLLEKWFNERKDDKNLIVKLHTGEGKTLIGLLILKSKLNSYSKPCVYICPNKYLVDQVVEEAKKFGIGYCLIDTDNLLPEDFLKGEKVLITHVQKLFNGKTIFGLGKEAINVNSIILDDAHACIDSIRDSFKIKLSNQHNLYQEIFELFKDSLSEQGYGTYLEICDKEYNSFLPIPYWDWQDKSEEIIRIISKYKKDPKVTFVWDFIKNDIQNYQGFISGAGLEIAPVHIPIENFSTFDKAEHRVLMSATTQDDSFFIKGLGFDLEAIRNPLTNPNQVWSGEKMLIIPSLIDTNFSKVELINQLSTLSSGKFGTVILVSSTNQAKKYEDLGVNIATTNDIGQYISELKEKKFDKPIVLVNRYDGIDLPDEVCRILIVDGKPHFSSLEDRYEETCRLESDLINVKIAQKVEQGLGRSVRGEKDYSSILIIDADLVNFIKSSLTNKYFSPQTKKQIEIGLEIAKLLEDEIKATNDPYLSLRHLINQSLNRDEGWKEYYKEGMNSIIPTDQSNNILDILTLEYKANKLSFQSNYPKAVDVIQEIINKYCHDNAEERAWYLQQKAKFMYHYDKIDSLNVQKAAYGYNRELLKPNTDIQYQKLEFINKSTIENIRSWINKHKTFEELNLNLAEIMSNLEFGKPSEKFESALKEVGLLLGFESERPDKEIKKGPDNLWCCGRNEYVILECKNQVLISRDEISKSEAGQMNTHCGWFKNQYGDAQVIRILIFPTNRLSSQADFTHDIRIMTPDKLKKLKKNIINFFSSLSKYEINSYSDVDINTSLTTNKLDFNHFEDEYTEEYIVIE